jgi:acylphosphatase
MEDKILYHIYVTGRVQGVGFRFSARSSARYYGITGFVKNMNDGSVYIEAVGSKTQLDEFVKWCRKGPGMGSVENVRIETSPPRNYEGFSIRH